MAPLQLICHTVGHNDDEWLTLTLCNEVIKDKVSVSLIAPSCLILTPTMLEIKNWILVCNELVTLLYSSLLITSRGIDVCLTLCVG